MGENGDTIIRVRDLAVYFYTNKRCNKAVDGVSLEIRRGRTLCVVGESGCGKSVTASAIMQLLPRLSRIENGEIIYYDRDKEIRIDRLPRNGKKMRSIRGARISIIFQEPMKALNPVYTIGFQIVENMLYHKNLARAEARGRAVKLLAEMGIPLAEQRVKEYPHQYSGGMRQRAMIAMAMACNPSVLIADEPTTSLDVTIQAQIFSLMENLKAEHNTAVMLITHDMGVVAELADDVAVMYMGNIVESGTVDEVLRTPVHPYTKALLASIPILGKGKQQNLQPIRGNTPDPYNRPVGCQFSPRCDYRSGDCSRLPANSAVGGSHYVRCWHYNRVLSDG